MKKNCSRIKNSYQLNRQCNRKWEKYLNRHFSREAIQIMYKYMKDDQFHWPPGKCRLKPHPRRMGKIKKIKDTKCW